MSKGRRLLYGLLAVGLIGLGAGGGTFASFNAATTNPGNTFVTGSLTLTNSANAGTACFSFGGSSNTSNQNGCSAIVTSGASEYPGAPIATGAVTISNGGTLSPSSFLLNAPSATDCADAYGPATQLTGSTSGTTFTFTGSTARLAVGDGVTGTGVPVGTTITAVNSGTLTLSNSTTTESSDTLSFSLGQVNLDSLGTRLCSTAQFFVVDIADSGPSTVNSDACVYGNCPSVAGQITGAGITNGATVTSLTVSSTGSWDSSISSGDLIEVTNASGASQTFTDSGAPSGTTITVNSATATAAFGSGSYVADLSKALPTTPSVYTLSTFDSSNPPASPITLSDPSTWTSPLPTTASRTFVVGVYLPVGSTNADQDLASGFGLTWTANQ
jgi:hypothetical protein